MSTEPAPVETTRPRDVLALLGFLALFCYSVWSIFEVYAAADGNWMHPSPGRVPAPMWLHLLLVCVMTVVSALAVVAWVLIRVRAHKARGVSTSTRATDTTLDGGSANG